MEKDIIEIYKKFGYNGITKNYIILKQKYPQITIKIIADALNKEIPLQLHKKQSNKVSAHMVAFRKNQIWLCDLLDMSNFSRTNKGNKWILLIIDVFTRKTFAEGLVNKEKNTVLDAFKKVINKEGSPELLISDNGSEFISTIFQNYLKEKKIFHQTNEPQYHPTLGIVDRLSRTIKEKIFKYFTDKDTSNWIDNLQSIINGYNNTPHSALNNIPPNQAENNKDIIRNINIEKNKISNHNFKKEQLVRKKLKKPTFAKGYKQIWTDTIYKIVEVKGVNALLDNDELVKLNDLQIVSKPNEPIVDNNKEKEVNKVEREAKHDKVLKSVGVDKSNIVETKRIKKPKIKLNL
jgi:hypothetical protein